MSQDYTSASTQVEIQARDLLTWLLKDTLGTLFIEPDRIASLRGSRLVGRTYFNDRLKDSKPFNRNASMKLRYLFEDLLGNKNKYDPVEISERLVFLLHDRLQLDAGHLSFSSSDTGADRISKTEELCTVISTLAFIMDGRTAVSLKELQESVSLSVITKDGTEDSVTDKTSSHQTGKESNGTNSYANTGDSRDSGNSSDSTYEKDKNEDSRNTQSRPVVPQILINAGLAPQIGTMNGNITFNINPGSNV